MNTRLLRAVRRNYMHSTVPRALGRRNCREWVRAVRLVTSTERGWLLSPVSK